MLPSFVLDGKGLSIRFSLFANEKASTAWVRIAAAELAQKSNRGATGIGRCSYLQCRRFFVIKRGRGVKGKPRTKYCCPEHRHLQHSIEGTRRKERSRNSQKDNNARRR